MLARMAFTSQDLAALDAAIASGELSVRTADGKTVELRSMPDLLLARDFVARQVALGALPRPAVPAARHVLADFRD